MFYAILHCAQEVQSSIIFISLQIFQLTYITIGFFTLRYVKGYVMLLYITLYKISPYVKKVQSLPNINNSIGRCIILILKFNKNNLLKSLAKQTSTPIQKQKAAHVKMFR